MLLNFEKVPMVATILLKANFVLKAINVFILNNLDFDGFMRSNKNKHHPHLVMLKGNKPKKFSGSSTGKINFAYGRFPKWGQQNDVTKCFKNKSTVPLLILGKRRY